MVINKDRRNSLTSKRSTTPDARLMRKTEIGEIAGMMAKIQKKMKKLSKAPQEIK